MQEQKIESSSTPGEYKEQEEFIICASDVDNAVLKRLIEEVQSEKSSYQINAYNRTHNRHNRGR